MADEGNAATTGGLNIDAGQLGTTGVIGDTGRRQNVNYFVPPSPNCKPGIAGQVGSS